ncbi:hypothetical protein Taro_000570 [Colocasia esculenta]|uniref:Uncharacterized protein n=1 Tax=Colocasia esculenta TaxID=4460 RepID=A0A843TDE0_COLES|nr:hypothetical protein [Colocasia esculenta]
MKGVEVEEFRDVEVYPDEELFVVVVRKNFKLCLDRLKQSSREKLFLLDFHTVLYGGCFRTKITPKSSFYMGVHVWRVVVKGNTQVGNIWRSRIEIFSSSVDNKICICRQIQRDLQKAEDWASRETISCVDLSTDDLGEDVCRQMEFVLSTDVHRLKEWSSGGHKLRLSVDGWVEIGRQSTFDHPWVKKKGVVPFDISWHDVELEISLKHSGLLEEMIRPINKILSEIKR